MEKSAFLSPLTSPARARVRRRSSTASRNDVSVFENLRRELNLLLRFGLSQTSFDHIVGQMLGTVRLVRDYFFSASTLILASVAKLQFGKRLRWSS
jgi:hypothetical protein